LAKKGRSALKWTIVGLRAPSARGHPFGTTSTARVPPRAHEEALCEGQRLFACRPRTPTRRKSQGIHGSVGRCGLLCSHMAKVERGEVRGFSLPRTPGNNRDTSRGRSGMLCSATNAYACQRKGQKAGAASRFGTPPRFVRLLCGLLAWSFRRVCLQALFGYA
jgi:hypothetical protein